MSLDWTSIQQTAGGNFKDYAADGDYTAQVADASVRKSSTGTNWLEISFTETDDYQFPKVSHALSFKNDAWRQWHFMNILKELGISEEKAKSAIEQCESKSSQDNKVSAYEQTFKRAAAKHPSIDIVVSTEEGSNGKDYARADFKNRAINMSNSKKQEQPKVETDTSIVDDGDQIELTDIPF